MGRCNTQTENLAVSRRGAWTARGVRKPVACQVLVRLMLD